jgi:hypothetical protein
VKVTDALSAGLMFVSDTASAGIFDPNTRVWTIGNLADHGTATLQIMAKVLPPPPTS